MNNKIISTVEKYRAKMEQILDYMEHNAEAGFKEWKGSALMLEAYRELGFKPVEAGNIPGFYADLDTGRPGPRILVFSELDGLPVPGHPNADPETNVAHACGHNAQCAALYGCAAALKELDLSTLSGSIRFCIVPAEEMNCLEFREDLREKGIVKYITGKQEYLARGYFDDCDMCFMVHTGGGRHKFFAKPFQNGGIIKTVEFHGKACHAAAPSGGINALYAANMYFNAINALRETFLSKDCVRVHPIITHGGNAVNAIPDRILVENQVRANNVKALKTVNDKVNRAAAASAAAIGARVELHDIPGYAPGSYDSRLAHYMMDAMGEIVGAENCKWYEGLTELGCTDMGDMSQVMPTVTAFCGGGAGTGHGVDYHIADFDSACMDSAAAQALILYRLLENNAAKAKDVVENAKPNFTSYKEYMDYLDSMFIKKQAVEYLENGETLLK